MYNNHEEWYIKARLSRWELLQSNLIKHPKEIHYNFHGGETHHDHVLNVTRVKGCYSEKVNEKKTNLHIKYTILNTVNSSFIMFSVAQWMT